MERKSSYSSAYKYKGCVSEEDRKSQRVKRRSVEQRDLRQTLVNKRRNIEELSPVTEGASVLSDKSYKDKTPSKPKEGKKNVTESSRRLDQLRKWKAEREEQRKKELEKQKPAFKVHKMSHKDLDLYKKGSSTKSVMKPIDKPLPVKKATHTKAAPEPPKVKKVNKTPVKSYENPTIGYMARRGVELKTAQSTSRQTRNQSKDPPNKKTLPQTGANHQPKNKRNTRQTTGDDMVQRTKKVDTVPLIGEQTTTDLNLTKVSTMRGERLNSRDSTYSFAPDDFAFNAASFVFNPLSPNSAQNFLHPGQDTCVSFLDHNPKISSTPNNKKRKGRSSVQQSQTHDSTLRESPKSDKKVNMSADKPIENSIPESANKMEVTDSEEKDAAKDTVNDTINANSTLTCAPEEMSEHEKPVETTKQQTHLRKSSRRSVLSKTVQEGNGEDKENSVDKTVSDTTDANATVTSVSVEISEHMEVDEIKEKLQIETPKRRSSRRSVLSKTVEEQKVDKDLDGDKKPSTPAHSALRRNRRSLPTSSLSDDNSMVTKSGRKTRRSVSTTVKEVEISTEKPTRRSARKSVLISTDSVIPEIVSEDPEDDPGFVNKDDGARKENGDKQASKVSTTVQLSTEKPTRRSSRKSVIISTEHEIIPETVPEDSEEDSVFGNEDAGKENNDKQAFKVDNVKTAMLFNKDIMNNDSDKKETPTRRGAKTRNKSFAGFRLPDANSVPLSASAKRKRRKTVMPKSPEEWVELLSKSPMIEMTRRTPKLNSSLPAIDFSDVDLSSPQLIKDMKKKGQVPSDLSEMPSDPKLNLFQALEDSEGLSSDTKEDNKKSDESAKQDNESKSMETETHSASDSKDSVEAMVVNGQEASGSLSTDQPVKQDSGSEVHDVKYFRTLLVTETDRLKELCKQWEDVNSANSLSEEVSGQIRTTVGQAVLLMDQRFKQFTGLVDNCEFKTGEKETTCTDLDGFWDMIYFQVEDVDIKFEKLKKLRDNNWVEDVPKPAVKKVKKKPKKSAVTKPAVKSKFAAFRAQMKKREDVVQSPNVKVAQSSNVLAEQCPDIKFEDRQKYVIPNPEEEKVIEMGVFFQLASPVKSPHPHCEGGTPKKTPSQVKQDKENQDTKIPASDNQTQDKPGVSLSVQTSAELLMRRTPLRKSYAPAIPSPLLVDSTPQPRPVRSCTKKTPLPRRLINTEDDTNMAESVDKENDDTSVQKQSENSASKKRRRSVRARKSVNFTEDVLSPKPDSTSDCTISDTSTDIIDPANVTEEKFVDDDVFAKYYQPMSVLYGNSEKENSPRSPKRRRTSSSLKTCPSSSKRRSLANKKVHFNSMANDDVSGAKIRGTPLPSEKRVTRRSLSQTSENEDFFNFGLTQNSPQSSMVHSRPSLLYTPPDLPNRPIQPLKEVPTATLISFTP